MHCCLSKIARLISIDLICSKYRSDLFQLNMCLSTGHMLLFNNCRVLFYKITITMDKIIDELVKIRFIHCLLVKY